MTVSPVTGRGNALDRVRRENETLYAVIKTVSSSLALERVLAGIVEIATDATGCHACFIYFLNGDRLVLQAASPRYSHLVGELEWGIDEGLTGWVARTRTPEFIRERAMEDPRMKYVPELEEERFQSMVAVPLLYRSGAVIGVVVLHTEAPREFDDDVLKFLVHTASLAAGAIENAQLYEETRRRVDALTTLTRLSQALAAVTLREDLHDAVTRGARELLGADTCQIWRLDPEADELVLAAADPPEPEGRASRPGRAALLLDMVRREWRGERGDAPRQRRGRRRAPACGAAGGRRRAARAALLWGGRPVLRGGGLGAPARGREPDRGRTQEGRADRAADRGEHRQGHVRGAGGGVGQDGRGEGRRGALRPDPPARLPARGARARGAGWQGHADGREEKPWPELAGRVQARLRRLYRRAFFDARHDSLRALVPLPALDTGAAEQLRLACEELGAELGVDIGLSDAERGAASARRRMREAADAARIARSLAAGGGAVSYERLGAYRYLVNLELDEAPRDRYGQAVAALIDYDRDRNARLVDTLERYLAARCSVAASARALYIHPNTVRQRLERIQQITKLDLREEDLLSLELALKVARLRRVREETGE